MAGGTWVTQNKEIPGVYIRYKASQSSPVESGTRGTVAIAKDMSWGSTSDVITINDISNTNIFNLLGYELGSDELRFVREIFRGTKENNNNFLTVQGSSATDGAQTLLIYRLNGTGGVAATASVDPLTITAANVGTRGNDISVTITADPDSEIETDVYAVYTVRVVVDNSVRFTQRVGTFIDVDNYERATVGMLTDNAWVRFTGTATAFIEPTAGVTLTGGVNPTITNASYQDFLDKIEASDFNIIVYDGTDTVISNIYREFVERSASEKGYYSQLVTSGVKPDTEYVISILNDYYIGDDHYPPNEATWWHAGVQAGCPLNVSLTNSAHPTATRVGTEYTSSELAEYLRDGYIITFLEFGEVRILEDVNTLVTFTEEKSRIFSKNHTIRTLWALNDRIYRSYSKSYIGKRRNTEAGRSLFKGKILEILNEFQGMGAIDAYDAEKVIVEKGEQEDAVYVYIVIYIGDFIVKVYVDIEVA